MSLLFEPKSIGTLEIPNRFVRSATAERLGEPSEAIRARAEAGMPYMGLPIPNPVFGCRAGKTAQVQLEVRGRNLPTGESHSPQAIHIVSNGGESWLEARASSSPPL